MKIKEYTDTDTDTDTDADTDTDTYEDEEDEDEECGAGKLLLQNLRWAHPWVVMRIGFISSRHIFGRLLVSWFCLLTDQGPREGRKRRARGVPRFVFT